MRKEIIISKDRFRENCFPLMQRFFENWKYNFIGMGMFDSYGVKESLSADNKFIYYPRDEKKVLIKRFPIFIAYNICFEDFEEILDLYWSDNIMERRIIAFYEEEKSYLKEDIENQKEIDFAYEAGGFIFAVENCPDSDNDEYLLVLAKDIESLGIEILYNT